MRVVTNLLIVIMLAVGSAGAGHSDIAHMPEVADVGHGDSVLTNENVHEGANFAGAARAGECAAMQGHCVADLVAFDRVNFAPRLNAPTRRPTLPHDVWQGIVPASDPPPPRG